ncbi:S8 family serine peptidase [Akkermansia glycaniphila]|uniref:S8 family serine peptidase n=1 Tax=Akkermansia glycaniphila TaxID=1679444 RepID=UPI001C011BDB|nr:S8 family serine peptidase [Akkermansia glycaniphila]MBT9449728.1 S8 family serine peptidase [Akkermansia glycaniphila]
MIRSFLFLRPFAVCSLAGMSLLHAGLPADMPTPTIPTPAWTDYLEAAGRSDSRQRYSVNERIGADAFYKKGIRGEGVRVANIEPGTLWRGHAIFTGIPEDRLYYGVQATADYSDLHATGVCGAIAAGSADNPRAMGIAPKADLYSASFFKKPQNAAAPPFSHTSLLTTYRRFFGKADVINTSWGTVWPTPTVEFYSYLLDSFCRAHPETLFVAAAGNTGTLPNPAQRGKVSTIASGFNNIAVGAQGNAPAYDELCPNSCHLPVDFINPHTNKQEGKRAGVDITAPGEMIVVPTINPKDPKRNDLFFKASGTSVAAPIVAGGACLLISSARKNGFPAEATDARVLKAVLLNAADKPKGWDNGAHHAAYRDQADVWLTTQGLDYKFGAGFLNLAQALKQHGEAAPSKFWNLYSLKQGQSQTIPLGNIPSGSTVTATLAWFQDCAIKGFAQAPGDAELDRLLKDGKPSPVEKPEIDYRGMADFNLELCRIDPTAPGKPIPVAASATPNNTVEHIRFQIPQDGDYCLKITFDRMTYGEPPAQGEPCATAWSITPPPATR